MTTGRSSDAGDAPRRRSAPWSRPPRSRTTAASSSTSSSSTLRAGYVGRPHGLDGSFHVVRADPALLADREELLLGDGLVRLTRRAGTPEKPILRIEGCGTRDEAEALRGTELRVPVDEAPPLEEGEFWARDLEGCLVVDGEVEVGVVERMIALPSCEALVVGDRLIPLVRDAVRSVDIAGRRIDVDLGFVDGR
jgi:16S rRNA processing protein RimM